MISENGYFLFVYLLYLILSQLFIIIVEFGTVLISKNIRVSFLIYDNVWKFDCLIALIKIIRLLSIIISEMQAMPFTNVHIVYSNFIICILFYFYFNTIHFLNILYYQHDKIRFQMSQQTRSKLRKLGVKALQRSGIW